MIIRNILVTILFLTLYLSFSDGHGRMMDPPARNSMWRLGFNNPINYNDNELYCGGRMVQWIRNKGKCGICGDAYHGKKDHEAGGKFANGIIGRSYHEGDIIPIVVHLTANHQGWFEFKMCPVNDPKKKVTQKCLDENVLQRADGKGTTFPIPQGKYNAFFNFSVKLPEGLTCKQCVMQWKYRTGNTWDKDDNSGVFCLGCGPQEEFYNCADVEILPKGEKSGWTKATVPSTGSGAIVNVTTTPFTISPTIRGSRNNHKNSIMTTKARTTSRPPKKFVTKVRSSKVTTPKPSKLGKFKEKLRTKKNNKKDKTSSQTYLIQPKTEVSKPRYRWKAAAKPNKLSKWLRSKSKQSTTERPKATFSKPKKTKLPSWLINTRKIQERRRKLIAKRQELLKRQEALRKQKLQKRQQKPKRYWPRTTTSTTTPTPMTTRRQTTTAKPARRAKKPTPPCKTANEKSVRVAEDLSKSMMASTDIPDSPAVGLRDGYPHTQATSPTSSSVTTRSPVFITRHPKDLVDHGHKKMAPKLRLSDNYEYANTGINTLNKDSTNGPEYVVEYPEHPVIENAQSEHPQVHRHRLPFRSSSPFANPSSPHANPLISYWWNQYQRPILNLWNNVRPVLKCHATITLGGGMDEWCTANCNANFCPGGMCVCQPERSVYPTYSVYPPQAQSWMNSYIPNGGIDVPQPVPMQNPYLLHREQRRQLEAYKQHNIKRQQQSPTYTGRNTIRRNVVVEEPDHIIKKQFAPTIRAKVTSQPQESNQIVPNVHAKVQKRSTSPTKSTTERPSATTPIPTTTTEIVKTTQTTTTTIPTTTSSTLLTRTKSNTTPGNKSPVLPTTSTRPKSHSVSFKASEEWDPAPKRTSTTWVINTLKSSRKSIVPKTTTKQNTVPDKRHKVLMSSGKDVVSQKKRNKLRSRIHFWRRKKNYNCHAIGRYSGLKRFDNWCSENCMQTICPLLICQCEIIQ
ncbi:hypothetical protein SNE40_007289 [Patella caerulea]|uniref:Chitin-binding type-4 domain-containing protein n=1 Tax=Patella caerulea TaxID=87958 RepID=A0AAN8JYI2_PATCE